jgi:hypothetical protein
MHNKLKWPLLPMKYDKLKPTYSRNAFEFGLISLNEKPIYQGRYIAV